MQTKIEENQRREIEKQEALEKELRSKREAEWVRITEHYILNVVL